jgi:hypothetical protein
MEEKFGGIEPSKRTAKEADGAFVPSDSEESFVAIHPRSTKKKSNDAPLKVDASVTAPLAVAAGNSVAAPVKVNTTHVALTGDADVDTAMGLPNNNVLDIICKQFESQKYSPPEPLDLSVCVFTKAHGNNLVPNAELVHKLMQ